eukprot:3873028-Lingulodinium_polyedra.AAC.1
MESGLVDNGIYPSLVWPTFVYNGRESSLQWIGHTRLIIRIETRANHTRPDQTRPDQNNLD